MKDLLKRAWRSLGRNQHAAGQTVSVHSASVQAPDYDGLQASALFSRGGGVRSAIRTRSQPWYLDS